MCWLAIGSNHGILKLKNGATEYQWASDVTFDGIRLEVLTGNGDVLFDVSVSSEGRMTVNTFGKDVAAGLIEAAIAIARQRSVLSTTE